MADAAVLIGGYIKKITLTGSAFYHSSGYLAKFLMGNVTYVHVNLSDFRSDDQNNISASAGYYMEEQFLEYVVDGNIKLYQISGYKLKDGDLKNAEVGDTIHIKKLKVLAPFDDFCQVYHLTWNYTGDPILDDNSNIKIPSTGVTTSTDNIPINDIARNFYNRYIEELDNLEYADPNATQTEKDEDQKRAASIISLIALNINRIEEDIFPLFSMDTDFAGYISSQNLAWTNDELFPEFTIIALQSYLTDISGFYNSAYTNQKFILNSSTDTKLYWLLAVLSENSLSVVPVYDKVKVLTIICKKSYGLKNIRLSDFKENLMVFRIIDSIGSTQIDDFLNAMTSIVFDRTNIYQVFYSYRFETSDKKKFVFSLYELWKKSSFNPYQNDVFSQQNLDRFSYNNQIACSPDPGNPIYTILGLSDTILNFSARPITLDYQSNSEYGFYFDNFKFYFSSDKEKVNFNYDLRHYRNTYEAPSGRILAVKDNYRLLASPGLYGTYHYFQPVSLVNKTQETIITMPIIGPDKEDASKINSLIPVFLLKYIDDEGDESDFNTAVGYFVDVASILVGGYGLASKIKYLSKLAKFSDAIIAGSEFGTSTVFSLYAATIAEAINVSSATVSFLIKLSAEVYKDEPWYENLKTWLMWAEILSGAGSILAEKALRTSARNLVDDFETHGWPSEFNADLRGGEARQTLMEAGDISNAVDSFRNGNKIASRPGLAAKFDTLSTVEKRRFYLDFEDASDDILNQLENDTDLVDYWKQVEYLKSERIKIEFLKVLRKFINDSYLEKHIFKGNWESEATEVIGQFKYHTTGLHSKDKIVLNVDAQITNEIPPSTGLNFYEADVKIWVPDPHNIFVRKNAKKSTFFPDQWVEKKILEEIAFAYQNKIKKSGNYLKARFEGTFSNGTKCVINIDYINTIESIGSIYPKI